MQLRHLGPGSLLTAPFWHGNPTSLKSLKSRSQPRGRLLGSQRELGCLRVLGPSLLRWREPPSSGWAGFSLQKGPLTSGQRGLGSQTLDPEQRNPGLGPRGQRGEKTGQKAQSKGEQKAPGGRKEKGDSESEGKKKELRLSAGVRKSTLAGKSGPWLMHLHPPCPQRASPGTLRVPLSPQP